MRDEATSIRWFDDEVFGVVPKVEVAVRASGALPNTVLELQLDDRRLRFELLVYPHPSGRTPAIVGLNFNGNAATLPGGRRHHRWPVDVIHEHGFALVTLHAADIDRDEHDFTDGVHGLLSVGHTFGTLAAWAWGLSRVLDWMLTRPDVFDPQRIVVAGHSRMGKAALLAAARDPRFAGVFANGSGCFGAALHAGKTGEQPSDIARFTHWFCPAFYEWVARSNRPSFDQDALLETIVPRPIAIGSAADDAWADPDAERRCVELLQSRHHSAPLFHRCRPGGHDINADDWRPALDFLREALSRPR